MFSTNNGLEVEVIDATEYGQCRCCLASGQHRDVTKEYYYNNIKEVYKDIFLECFNLPLSPHNKISSLICEKCVHRLRDASTFRMMAAATEAQLLHDVIFKSEPDNDTVFDAGVTEKQNFTTEIKVECDPSDDLEADVYQGNWDSFDNDSDNEQPNEAEQADYERMIDERMNEDNNGWSSESSEKELVIDESRLNEHPDESDTDHDVDRVGNDCESTYSTITTSTTSALDDEPCEIIEGEPKLLMRFPTAAPPPLPKRGELPNLLPVYNAHLKQLQEKRVVPQSIEWYFKVPQLKESLMSDKQTLAVNATTIFEYSNAAAFKTKVRDGYPCFYCREVCKFDKLREHQKNHEKASIYKLLTKYNADEFVVYADITDLQCTICNRKVPNLNELRTHLTTKHGRKIFASADRVIPFKLKEKDFDCQICGQKFDGFGAVERHMNTHFGSFMCKTCGVGFITKHRLAVHNYTLHKDENVVCEVCKKIFRTQMKYRLHYEVVHKNVKKFRCTKCSQRFIDYSTRQKHLVEEHGEPPVLYKCHVCDKGFNKRFNLASHVKRCHIFEKSIKCLQCSFACHTKSELKDHMIKHQSNQNRQRFECPICKKTYGRNRTLAMHMKIHKNEAI